MTLRAIALAATLAVSGVSAAQAEQPTLAPALAHKIDLGAVNGVAYYTVENGSFRVVATVGQEDGQPVRLETVLVPGQSVVLSTTTENGAVPARIEISREADDLRVQAVAVTN